MSARRTMDREVFDIEDIEAEDLRAEVERAIAESDPNDLAPLAETRGRPEARRTA